ncbi:MAG: fibronectin type III domain-containing protein [Bifidobacteriaceae bacterium]|jgi:hypothetical protein|nr:fibronectin type III domain-containing protein [Bifidobacteriaceae bacterium]
MSGSRLRPWVRRWAWLAPVVVFIGLAVTRPGYPVAAVDLTDGSVWVTKLGQGEAKVALYNAAIEELTGGFTITPAVGELDVAQAGASVAITQADGFMTVDVAALKLGRPVGYPVAEADVVDGDQAAAAQADAGGAAAGGAGAGRGEAGQAAAAQADAAQADADGSGAGRVGVGGDAVLVVGADATRAWLRPFAPTGQAGQAGQADQADQAELGELGELGAEEPDLETGPGGRIVIAPDGNVFAVAADGAVSRVWLDWSADSGARSGTAAGAGSGTDSGDGAPEARLRRAELGRLRLGPEQVDQISAVTAVGGEVYALVGASLAAMDGLADLSAYGDPGDLRLQTPSADVGAASGAVAVATPDALLLVDRRGRVKRWQTGNWGEAAAPVAVGECVHAAWSAPPGGGDNYLALCAGEPALGRALQAVSAGSRLVFRVNRQVVVLNDVQDGRVWMPAQDDRVRDALNWDQIDPKADDQAAGGGGAPGQQLDCDDKTAKPVAADDAYGFRPGASVILMVLDNDAASNCAALAVERVDGLDPSAGTAEPVLAGRAIQFTPAVGGAASFTYTVSDAAGQTDSATVALTPASGANRPPDPPPRAPELVMELGATATHRALAAFTDPDGDAISLVGATTADKDLTVWFEPGGTVTIRAGEGGQARSATVTLAVQDALGAAAPPVALTVELRQPGSVVPAADVVKGAGLVGQDVVLDLREAVRTAHASPLLFTLDAQDDLAAAVELDAASGELVFKAAAANTYLLGVSVSAGGVTGKLSARIDVAEAGAAALVAVADTAYVRPGKPTLIDPLANDSTGGEVPVLQEFEPAAAVEAVPLQRRYLEISDAGGSGASGDAGGSGASGDAGGDPGGGGSGAEVIYYTLAAGGRTAIGAIRVVRVEAGAGQDPVATGGRLTVRAGGVVTIPALEQAFDPDGDEVSILAAAPIEPVPSCGTVYASSLSVRYQAPAEPCAKPVTVTVPLADEAGGSALASFTIEVHRSQGAAKAAPEPRDLTAQVARGEEVKIAVPLTGIDVDGDGVSLQQGIDTQPLFGAITEIGPDYIKYQAAPDQAPGTDSFTYAVEDWAANRATAQVMIGVADRPQAQTGVVARDDRAVARPGKVLEIPVLANDVDLSGRTDLGFCEDEPLGLPDATSAAPGDGVSDAAPAGGVPDAAPGDGVSDADGAVFVGGVEVRLDREGQRLVVALPQRAGQYQVVYYACGASGDRDSAAVNLRVDPAAVAAAPRAKDIVSPPQETIDKVSVDIDVRRWAYNPSGPTADLELFLPAAAGAHARLKNDSEITVTLQDELPTIVFYGLRNLAPEAQGATAYGSITVPPISRPPYLRPDLDPIRAEAGQETIINLDEFVAVARGRAGAFLHLPTADGHLTAGHGQVAPAASGRAIAYRAASGHVGADRIEFWVSDTADSASPDAKKSRLWLDVTVAEGRRSQLTFTDPAPQVERDGPARTVDLAAFAQVDGASLADPAELAVALGPVGPGLRVQQAGTVVTIQAGLEAVAGQRSAITLTLAYGGGAPKAGLSLTVTVVETKQPAVKPNPPDPVKVERGQPKAVPVLEGVFDPWSKTSPARVEAVTVTGDGHAQASGQSIIVTAGSATSAGSAASSADGGQLAVGFAVVDAAGRRQTGSFKVIARGKPAAPASVTAALGDGGRVRVTWAPVTGAATGGEPVESYRVVLAGAICDAAPGGQNWADCRAQGLDYGSQYRVEVWARNAVGESEQPGVGSLDYQVAPDPPVAGEATAGKNQIHLSWTPPAAGAGSVDHYTVSCDGRVVVAPAGATELTVTGLAQGVSYACSVSAVNAKGSSVSARFAAVQPYGDPGQPSPPRVSWTGQFADLSGNWPTVQVEWDEVADGGAAVSHTLLVNGGVIGPCAATSCVLALEAGSTAVFQIQVESSREDVATKVSDPAGPYRLPPAPLADLAAPGLTASAASPAGQAWVEVAWPQVAARSGYAVDLNGQFDGWTMPSPGSRFEGLGSGSHSVRLAYCLRSVGGVAVMPGVAAEALCATSPPAEITVTTKPAPPVGCAATRPDRWTVAVECEPPSDGGGLDWSWWAAIDGLGAGAQARGTFDLAIPAGEAAGGMVEVWVENALGASFRLRLSYPPANEPEPPSPQARGPTDSAA